MVSAPPKEQLHFYAIFLTCFAAFGGFLFGYDTGNISGIKEMPGWLELFGTATTAADGTVSYALSSGRNSLVTSILSAGTFVGALGSYPLGDYFGRRYAIVIYLWLFAIGVACQTGGKTVPPFVVGRVFAGLGVGGTSCLIPLYQSECAPKSIRGAVISLYQFAVTVGLLIAAVVVNATKNRHGPSCYQIPIACQFIWAFILGVGILILPESPRWLVLRGRNDQAKAIISRLINSPIESPEVQAQYDEMHNAITEERALGSSSYIDCFRNGPAKNGLRTFTGICLQSLQQLTGINFIMYYGTQFFKNAGIENSFTITIATSVVNVGMTVPGILAIDRFGRRSLLLVGAVCMATCELIVAIVGVAIDGSNMAGQRVLVGFACMFIGSFAATWGPVAWVVCAEIYNPTLRAKSNSLSTAANWLWNFGIGYATPYLVDDVPGSAGLGSKVFFIWGGCCVLCFFFVFFFVPETASMSLEQIDHMYRNTSVLGANKYRRQLFAGEIDIEEEDLGKSEELSKAEAEHKEVA